MDAQVMNNIPKDLHNKFLSLACGMSPENLYCDGEISRSAAKKKLVYLKAEWKKLEKELGRTVSEDEVWQQRFRNK